MQDYAITLDMAKELSMVQNNDKGRQARRYFIECENKLKEISPKVLLLEYNMVTHSRDFSHELVTYQLFNY